MVTCFFLCIFLNILLSKGQWCIKWWQWWLFSEYLAVFECSHCRTSQRSNFLFCESHFRAPRENPHTGDTERRDLEFVLKKFSFWIGCWLLVKLFFFSSFIVSGVFTALAEDLVQYPHIGQPPGQLTASYRLNRRGFGVHF